jgi:hypothetical protein
MLVKCHNWILGEQMDALERLVAVEELKKLKARYFRCMDTKDWAGFADVFAPDAVMDMSSEMRDGTTTGSGITRGNQAIADFVRAAVDHVRTVHHGHMPELELESDTTARGVWAMEDLLRWPPGHPVATIHGFGHYHETYTKVDGAWRIQSTRLTRLRVDVEAGGDGRSTPPA